MTTKPQPKPQKTTEQNISREIPTEIPTEISTPASDLLPIKDRRQDYSKQRQELNDIPVASIYPAQDAEGNLLNPRSRFDEDYIEELSRSICIHGLLSPITVRPVADKRGRKGLPPERLAALEEIDRKVEAMDGYGTSRYEIIAGECRWRAAKKANLLVIPAIIRGNVSDAELAELALIENIRRNDLTVMEKARAFQRCIALGTKQKDIGEKAGVGQSRVANLVGLLELPADVQEMIEDGKLSAGHGIQLARYKDFPDLCSSVAQEAVVKEFPVKKLETGALLNTNNWRMPDAPLAKSLTAYPSPIFDWKAVCPSCPFKAYREEGEMKFCLNPAHFDELTAAAQAERNVRFAAEAERQKTLAVQRAKEAEEKLKAATTKAGRIEAEQERQQANAARQALSKGLPKTEYGKIERLSPGCPAECAAGKCPCHIKAIDRYDDKIVNACADPKRNSRLGAAATKEVNKERRLGFDALRDQLSAVAWDSTMRDSQARRLMAIVSWDLLRNTKGTAKKDVAARLPEGDEFAAIRALLGRTGYEVMEADAHAALSSLSPTQQLLITGEVLLRAELIERYDYGDKDAAKSTKTAYFLSEPISSEPSRLFPCADCNAKDAGVFYVDANGYEMSKGLLGGSWVCLACQTNRQAEVAEEQLLCDQCGEPLTAGAFEQASLSELTSGTALRMSSGEMAVRGKDWNELNRFYCHLCGPTRRDDGTGILEPTASQRITDNNIPGSDLDDEPSIPDCESRLCGCGEPTCLGTCHDAHSELVDEGIDDDWEYAPPPSNDDDFCRSCLVRPVSGNQRLCGACDPLLSDREEAALVR